MLSGKPVPQLLPSDPWREPSPLCLAHPSSHLSHPKPLLSFQARPRQLSPSQKEPMTLSPGSLLCDWGREGCVESCHPSLWSWQMLWDCNSEVIRQLNPKTIYLKSPFCHLFLVIVRAWARLPLPA